MMKPPSASLSIQLVYAEPERCWQHDVVVPAGTTVAQAIQIAGWDWCPRDLSQLACGIYGERVEVDHVLSDYDRIEFYRPLLHDPKQARRERALAS